MRVGNLVRGKARPSSFDIKRFISGSESRESMLIHKMNSMEKTKFYSTNTDTIELWDCDYVFGMIVKIDSDISGYGIKLIQVLLERRPVWFFAEDLELVPIPTPVDTNNSV